MLIILYGSFGDIYKRSKEFFVQNDFGYIKKLNYSDTEGEYDTPGGKRELVSKENFYCHTDSLFRYEINGYIVGFQQNQIMNAVTGKSNNLLTISTTNISILSEIKKIYGNSVRIIFCYIDDEILREKYNEYDLPFRKREERIQVGRELKRCFAENSELFDDVVIYSGENSAFNYQNLMKQYQRIISEIKPAERKTKVEKIDVFIAYSRQDTELAEIIYDALRNENINAFLTEKDLKVGDHAESVIKDAITKAKITVAILSRQLLESKFALSELKYAIELAKNNGTIILPCIIGDLNFSELEKDGLDYLKLISCIRSANNEDIVSELIEKVKLLIHGSEQLQALSFQVESYCHLKDYQAAKEKQMEHIELSQKLFRSSDGTIVSLDGLAYSNLKLVGILIESGEWHEALETTAAVLSYTNEKTNPELMILLKKHFALCCDRLKMSRDDVESYAQSFFRGDRLLDIYDSTFVDDSLAPEKKDSAEPPETDRIVEYAEAVINTFYSLLESELSAKNIGNLITGYERILDFCKHMKISGNIAAKCVKRIMELKNLNIEEEKETQSPLPEGLKIYLGKALPGTGNYDVFISFKSEDTDLAEKIFDYLKDSGMEVFFSPKTLPQLKDSEYEKAIYRAMANSKHMVLVGSNPEYFKTEWVADEWSFFRNEIRKKRKNGNMVIVLSDQYVTEDGKLPEQLRQTQIVPTSTFRKDLMSYLW